VWPPRIPDGSAAVRPERQLIRGVVICTTSCGRDGRILPCGVQRPMPTLPTARRCLGQESPSSTAESDQRSRNERAHVGYPQIPERPRSVRGGRCPGRGPAQAGMRDAALSVPFVDDTFPTMSIMPVHASCHHTCLGATRKPEKMHRVEALVIASKAVDPPSRAPPALMATRARRGRV
jgi:hypothetical protein